MAIPLASSTITVTRSTANVPGAVNTVTGDPLDPYDPEPDYPSYPNDTTTIAKGVRAVVSPPSATTNLIGGQRDVYLGTLTCDPVPNMQADDQVTDSATDIVWRVLSVIQVNAVGLVFTKAQMRVVTGYSG